MNITVQNNGTAKEVRDVKHFQVDGNTVFVEQYDGNLTDLTGEVVATGNYEPERALASMELDNDKWENYWDANPKAHGGAFIKWNGNGFRTVITEPRDMHPEEVSEGRIQFGVITIYPDEIWVDGNPERGFTEDIQSRFNTWQNGPETPYDLTAVKAVCHDHILHFGMYHLNGQEQWVEPENYWSEVAEMTSEEYVRETFNPEGL